MCLEKLFGLVVVLRGEVCVVGAALETPRNM